MDGRAGRLGFVVSNAFNHGANFCILCMLCWYTNTIVSTSIATTTGRSQQHEPVNWIRAKVVFTIGNVYANIIQATFVEGVIFTEDDLLTPALGGGQFLGWYNGTLRAVRCGLLVLLVNAYLVAVNVHLQVLRKTFAQLVQHQTAGGKTVEKATLVNLSILKKLTKQQAHLTICVTMGTLFWLTGFSAVGKVRLCVSTCSTLGAFLDVPAYIRVFICTGVTLLLTPKAAKVRPTAKGEAASSVASSACAESAVDSTAASTMSGSTAGGLSSALGSTRRSHGSSSVTSSSVGNSSSAQSSHVTSA